MQYEHTNAEELKEVAERQAVEIAEKVGTLKYFITTLEFRKKIGR